MRIGYTKGASILTDEFMYERFCQKHKVERIFADKYGEKVAIEEMFKYLRPGDEVVVNDITDISDSAGELVEILIRLHAMKVAFHCKKRNIDTAFAFWDTMLTSLDVYSTDVEPIKGRVPRFIEDLDECIDLVEQGLMTVTDACKKMQIGRSTYYRRAKAIRSKPPKEKHMEDFDEYERLVRQGELSIHDACKKMNIGVSTYYKLRKEMEAEGD